MKYLTGALLLSLLPLVPAPAREAKERDKDVNYDEASIPRYDLPPLLVAADGTPVTTPTQWHNVRRPQILALFSNLVYGRVPEPVEPIRTEFKVVKSDPRFMGGKATRKDIDIKLSNKRGSVTMRFLVLLGNCFWSTEPDLIARDRRGFRGKRALMMGRALEIRRVVNLARAERG
jgi:hypothetical protein